MSDLQLVARKPNKCGMGKWGNYIEVDVDGEPQLLPYQRVVEFDASPPWYESWLLIAPSALFELRPWLTRVGTLHKTNYANLYLFKSTAMHYDRVRVTISNMVRRDNLKHERERVRLAGKESINAP